MNKVFGSRVRQIYFYVFVGMAWLLLWIINSYFSSPRTFGLQSINEVWRAVYIVLVNFFFFEFLLPAIRKRRSYFLISILTGIGLVICHLLLVSVGLYAWKYLGIISGIYTQLRQATLIPDGIYYRLVDEVFYQAQGGISSTIFFGVAKLFYDNYKLKQAAQLLRIEKQEAELNYLRSQTNPHFLFNTLNNIYALSLQKSDFAPEAILRLSKILRFMLYETGDTYISVDQERDVICDYIALEKLRYDNSLKINFVHRIEKSGHPIPPLMLIPLVENAFKHGVSESSIMPFIDINLSVEKEELLFVVKNSSEITETGRIVKENIGLSNLRRQLELQYTEYTLSVLQSETDFTAVLKINLASHV